MPLNQVQRDFVNQTARPHIETFIRGLYRFDVFVADYDAIQAGADALPTDGTVLEDNATGDGPRDDAPTLTGQQVKQLRDLSAQMSALVTGQVRTTMIGKLVRSLEVVLRFAAQD